MARCAWKWGCWQQFLLWGSAASSAAPCTDLGDHDGVNAHLLEAPGVVEHVGPAQGQGEHHGGHVQLLATEVQHHRAQEQQGVDKAGREAWCECRDGHRCWEQSSPMGGEQDKGLSSWEEKVP